MMEEIKHEQCGRCFIWRLPNLFLNDKGRKLKTCKTCRDDSKKNREKNKCPHNRQKSRCQECDPAGYLVCRVAEGVNKAIKNNKRYSNQYVGCDINEFKEHIQSQFKCGMTWDNYGKEWYIDHIIPVKYENPTMEEVIKRLHFTNTQPLWATDSRSKRMDVYKGLFKM